MTRQDSSRQFDAREEGKGHVAAGNARRAPTHDIDDSPTEGSVPGLLIREALSDGVEGEATSEWRAKKEDSRKADAVAELTKLERNAEDGRE